MSRLDRGMTGHVAGSATKGGDLFQLEGDYWTVTYQGVTLRIRDCKGMRYLAYLLRHPDERFDVRELVVAIGGRELPQRKHARHPAWMGRNRERDRSTVGKRIRGAIAHLQTHHPALGRFLRTSIHTGQECVYVTDPDRPLRRPSRTE